MKELKSRKRNQFGQAYPFEPKPDQEIVKYMGASKYEGLHKVQGHTGLHFLVSEGSRFKYAKDLVTGTFVVLNPSVKEYSIPSTRKTLLISGSIYGILSYHSVNQLIVNEIWPVSLKNLTGQELRGKKNELFAFFHDPSYDIVSTDSEEEHLREEEAMRAEARRKAQSSPYTPRTALALQKLKEMKERMAANMASRHQEEENENSDAASESESDSDVQVIDEQSEAESATSITQNSSFPERPPPLLSERGNQYREVVLIRSDDESEEEMEEDEVVSSEDDDLPTQPKRRCTGLAAPNSVTSQQRQNTYGALEEVSEDDSDDTDESEDEEEEESGSDGNEGEAEDSDGDDESEQSEEEVEEIVEESEVSDTESDEDLDVGNAGELVMGEVPQDEPTNGRVSVVELEYDEGVETEELEPELEVQEEEEEDEGELTEEIEDENDVETERIESEDSNPAVENDENIHLAESELSDSDSDESVHADGNGREDSGEETEPVEYFSGDEYHGAELAEPEGRGRHVREMEVIREEDIEVITISDSEEEEQARPPVQKRNTGSQTSLTGRNGHYVPNPNDSEESNEAAIEEIPRNCIANPSPADTPVSTAQLPSAAGSSNQQDGPSTSAAAGAPKKKVQFLDAAVSMVEDDEDDAYVVSITLMDFMKASSGDPV